jgi:hypothetical protein
MFMSRLTGIYGSLLIRVRVSELVRVCADLESERICFLTRLADVVEQRQAVYDVPCLDLRDGASLGERFLLLLVARGICRRGCWLRAFDLRKAQAVRYEREHLSQIVDVGVQLVSGIVVQASFEAISEEGAEALALLHALDDRQCRADPLG